MIDLWSIADDFPGAAPLGESDLTIECPICKNKALLKATIHGATASCTNQCAGARILEKLQEISPTLKKWLTPTSSNGKAHTEKPPHLDRNPTTPLRDTALEPVFRRVPPKDTLAEQSLLGSILMEPALIDTIQQQITPSDFYAESHREIYKAMLELAAQGKLSLEGNPNNPIDVVSLQSELRRHGVLEVVGGITYIVELEQATPTSLNAAHWARIVHNHAARRDMIRGAYNFMEQCYNGARDEELQSLHQHIVPIGGILTPTSQQPLPAPQSADAWFRQEEERFANVTFIWDGILEAGGISIVTGKKGNGKSTFVRSLALAIARGQSILSRETVASKVWYLDLEPGGRGRIDTWRNLGWCNEDPLDLLTIPPVAGREGVFEWVKKHIIEREYKVVVIDTMFKLLKIEGSNDYDKGVYAQVPLEEIARDTGVHFILIHHARKNAIIEAQSVAEAVLGATSLAGAACACMLINRRRDKFTFKMDPPRYGTAIEGETVLQLDSGGGIIAGGSWKGTWAKISKDSVWEAAVRQQGWFVARDIEAVDETSGERMKGRTVNWALNCLVEDGKLDRRIRDMKMTRGKPPYEYLVKPDHASTSPSILSEQFADRSNPDF